MNKGCGGLPPIVPIPRLSGGNTCSSPPNQMQKSFNLPLQYPPQKKNRINNLSQMCGSIFPLFFGGFYISWLKVPKATMAVPQRYLQASQLASDQAQHDLSSEARRACCSNAVEVEMINVMVISNTKYNRY